MSHLRLRWLVSALLLTAACGGGDPELPPVYRHVSLRPPETELELPGTTIWRRFDVLRERPDWKVTAGRSNVIGVTHGRTVTSVLWLAEPVGDPPVLEVRIPAELEAGAFNELLVTALAPRGEFEVAGSLWRRGERVVESTPVGLAATRKPQTLSLPVPQALQELEPFDELVLTFRGAGARVGLASVHLRERALRSFLPSPRAAPRLIRVEDEWRAAIGLSSRRPIEGRLLVPADAELNLHFAVPPELDLANRKDSVRVSITSDSDLTTALRVSLGPESEVRIEEGPRRIPPRRARKGSGRQSKPAKGQPRRRRPPPKQPVKKEAPPLPEGAFEDQLPPSLVEQPEADDGDQVRYESPWTEIVLPLDDFALEEVTVRVELVDWPEVETVCAVTPPVVVRPTARPETVVLITAGSLRADHVGASGAGVEIDTALLDQLAGRGVLFEDCLAPSNDSRTSLLAIMTGTWPPRDPLEDAPATLATRFRQAGFATVAVLGNAGLNPDFAAVTGGFDRVVAPNLGVRNAGDTIERFLSGIDELKGFPLFVWLHLSDAQGPYDPPDNFRFEYYPSSSDPYSLELPELAEHMRPAWDPDLRDPAWPEALYRSEVTYLDRRLREVFEHPRLRRGILAITADHGENLTSHEAWFSHSELYPDTLAIPLLLAYPGAPAGGRIARPVSSVDLGRTLLDLAGLPDQPFPGRRLLGPNDRDAVAPRFAFAPETRPGAITSRPTEDPGGRDPTAVIASKLRFAVSPQEQTVGVQAGDWFLVLQLGFESLGDSDETTRHAAHAVRLFDIATDPRCENEVLGEHPEVGGQLHALLLDWLRQPGLAVLELPPPPPEGCTCSTCSIFR